MDKLVETPKEKFWQREAWVRDEWVKAQAAKLKPGSWILDAGAGASKYRPVFAHCRYETQDFCQYQGPLVKYLQPVNYVCDITRIPLPDESLDCILCTEVLEHVVDPMAVLREFRRLLKPGGRLLLTAPQAAYVHMEPYHFYGGFTQYWYRHWLPECGFTIDSIIPQGGPGRCVVSYLQGFYQTWGTWERTLPPWRRGVSLLFRIGLAKLPVHYLLPWLLGKLERNLDQNKIVLGLMVGCTRAEPAGPGSKNSAELAHSGPELYAGT